MLHILTTQLSPQYVCFLPPPKKKNYFDKQDKSILAEHVYHLYIGSHGSARMSKALKPTAHSVIHKTLIQTTGREFPLPRWLSNAKLKLRTLQDMTKLVLVQPSACQYHCSLAISPSGRKSSCQFVVYLLVTSTSETATPIHIVLWRNIFSDPVIQKKQSVVKSRETTTNKTCCLKNYQAFYQTVAYNPVAFFHQWMSAKLLVIPESLLHCHSARCQQTFRHRADKSADHIHAGVNSNSHNWGVNLTWKAIKTVL